MAACLVLKDSSRSLVSRRCVAVPRRPRHLSGITTLQISSGASFRLLRRQSPPASLESAGLAADQVIESIRRRRTVHRFLHLQSDNDYAFATTVVSAR